MKKTTYFNGTDWSDTPTSEVAFRFIIEDNKLTIKAPEGDPNLFDKETFEAECRNVMCGYAAWSNDRCALTRKNDGAGIKLIYKDASKDFVATAPESCQMKKHCQERGYNALAEWVTAQEARLGFVDDETPEEGSEASAEESKPAKEPEKEPEKAPEKEPEKDSKKEPEAKQPTPATATVSKLPADPADWSDADIDAMFDGKAEF